MPKLPINQMAQFVVRNPFTAAAAVFAPIFASNEDRGYFRTALITTPVIFAAGNYAPSLFGGVRGAVGSAVETRNLIQNAESWTRFEQQTYNDLNILFKDRSVPGNVIDRALSNYLVTQRRSRDLLKEQRTLNRLFTNKFVITEDLIKKSEDLSNPRRALKAQRRIAEIEEMQKTKGTILSRALESARQSSLSPSEWAESRSQWDSVGQKNLTNDEMLAMFDRYSSRPEFVKTLRNRLREMKTQTYGGTLQVFDPTNRTAGMTNMYSLDLEGVGARTSQAQAMFEKQFPEASLYLKRAHSAGTIDEAIITAEDVVKGVPGKLLNVKVRHNRGNIKPLTIPVADPTTGTVRLSGNAIGVADYVIGPDLKEYDLTTWITKQIAESPTTKFFEGYPGEPSLQGEIDAHAYWYAGDPEDARRMSEIDMAGEEGVGEFTSGSRRLRGQAAKFTKLAMFPNEDGELVPFRRLTAGMQQAYMAKALNQGRYINMSGEAGVYEGRLVRRNAALLSPYGAPSAEKQDSIWRSTTKEMQLRYRSGEPMPEDLKLGWKSTEWQKLYGGDLPAAKFTVGSLDPAERMNLIAKLRSEGRGDLADVLGRMGETGFVMNEEVSNRFSVEGLRKYNMTELGVKAGDVVTPGTILGFRDAERVVVDKTGIVENVAAGDSGFVVNVRHNLEMQGAKLDIAGVKGMIPSTMGKSTFEELRSLAGLPEGVNVLAPAEYFANKVEPAQAYLGIGSELVRRLPEDVSAQYRARMSTELGTNWEAGQLVIDASKIQSLKDKDAAIRLMKLSEISEEFFAKASVAIRNAGGYQDPVLTAFVHEGKDVGNWMLKNSLPAMGFTWDHSLMNAPRFASITHDIMTHLGFQNNWAGLKALQSRVVTSSGGDARQSLDFLKRVMGEDFSSPYGTSIPLSEAFPGGRRGLTEASGRAGTIFDPSIDKFRKNFSIDLGNGQFLPVPGTEAYGAEAKMYGPGEYQTRRWQHTLQELAFAPEKERAGYTKKVLEQYQEMFGVGKGNVMRPYLQDPNSVAGAFSVIDTEGDPFVARISPELAAKVRSKRLRDALESGEEVMAMAHRQPTNMVPYVKVKIDKAMTGTLDVGVSERLLRSLIGDQDKDPAYLLFLDARKQMTEGSTFWMGPESEAAQEAAEALSTGRQLEYLKAWESVKGQSEVAEEVAKSGTFAMKSLRERMAGFSQKVENRVGTAINRMAGASIGSFSNIVTELNEQMLRGHEIMRDPTMAARLNAIFFDIRQAPISARKAPSFTLEQAMSHLGELKRAMVTPGGDEAARRTHAALINLGRTLNPKFHDTQEFKYMMEQGIEDINTWARGRTPVGTLAKEALTNVVNQSKPFIEQGVSKDLKLIASEGFEKVLGPIHLGGSGSETATTLGVIAEGLSERGRSAASSATGKLSSIFSKHSKTLAMGAGIMAALGIAMQGRTAPVATFSRQSGNRFRPERTIGVADNVPGEPMPGQMAPSQPPRRMEAGPQGVKTGVVAPMQQRTDLEVRMRSRDRSSAAETSRMLSQIPGSGSSNITINYRDRTKIRGLRTREQIRDIMNG